MKNPVSRNTFEAPKKLTEIIHGKRRDVDLQYSSRNKKENHFSITNCARELFLPVGYPYSVHRCYAKVHLCQFIETFATSLISVMTAEALLHSVGTSSSPTATGGAAVAIEWTITDGFGEIGKLFIIQQYAHLFDSHPKSAKLFGEICAILGAASHIATIFFPRNFLLFASIGYCLRGIYVSIWIASHTIFNSYLAMKENNMGDLYAKDDSQISFAHILGLAGGISILSFSNAPTTLVAVYIIFSCLQIIMTILLIRSADYEILNMPRMRLTSHEFVNHNRTFSCMSLQGRENWLGEHIIQSDLPKIRLGKNVDETLKDEWLSERIAITINEKYALSVDVGLSMPTFRILLHQDGSGEDVFKAVLHATKCAQLSSGSLYLDDYKEAYEWTNRMFPVLMEELKEMDWRTDLIVWTDNGVRIWWKPTDK
jgi:hypothetical protein